MIFPAANAIYRRETYDNYPGARAILQVVYEGLQLPMDLALRVELRWLRENPALAGSGGDDPLAVRFHAGAQQRRAAAGRRPADEDQERRRHRRRLHGRRHRLCHAPAGIEVMLIDRDQEAADKGKAHIHKMMTDQINKGRAKAAERDALLARITPPPITPRSRTATSWSKRCSRIAR